MQRGMFGPSSDHLRVSVISLAHTEDLTATFTTISTFEAWYQLGDKESLALSLRKQAKGKAWLC